MNYDDEIKMQAVTAEMKKKRKQSFLSHCPCGNYIRKSKVTGKNTSQAPGRPSLDTSQDFCGASNPERGKILIICEQKKEQF